MSHQLKLWDSEREVINRPKHTACHRTKGPSKSREELAGCGPTQPHWRQGGGERGRLGPKDHIPYRTANSRQFLIKDFLRFWMVDIRREGGSRRDTGRRHPTRAGGDWAGDAEGRRRAAPGESAPVKRLAA